MNLRLFFLIVLIQLNQCRRDKLASKPDELCTEAKAIIKKKVPNSVRNQFGEIPENFGCKSDTVGYYGVAEVSFCELGQYCHTETLLFDGRGNNWKEYDLGSSGQKQSTYDYLTRIKSNMELPARERANAIYVLGQLDQIRYFSGLP